LAAALAALLTAVAIVACGAADEPPHVACRALGEPADRAPGAGRLAVASDPDGSFEFDGDQSDLYLLNADGSGRRRLTTARGNDFTPAWSPDGTQIAFRSNRDREHPLDPNDHAASADRGVPKLVARRQPDRVRLRPRTPRAELPNLRHAIRRLRRAPDHPRQSKPLQPGVAARPSRAMTATSRLTRYERPVP
jgi:hypothetical protein